MAEKMKRKNLKVVLLMLVFIVPMLVSWVMFQYPDYFNFHTTNHGRLIQPLVRDANLLDASHPSWQIVFAPENCLAQSSEQEMFALHQLRRALGKDADRVSLTLLTERACAMPDSHDFRKVLTDTAPIRQALEDHQIEGKIFLVDPQGNMFMYYSQTMDHMRILKDLKRVLEVSQIG